MRLRHRTPTGHERPLVRGAIAATLVAVLSISIASAAGPGARSGACAQLPPPERRSADPMRLARQMDALLAAPAGSIMMIDGSAGDLSAYLSRQVLPLVGAAGMRSDVVFAPDRATLVLRDNGSRPLVSLALVAPASDEGATLDYLCLGGTAVPGPLTSALSRVAFSTLSDGDLGFALLSLTVADGHAYVTVARR